MRLAPVEMGSTIELTGDQLVAGGDAIGRVDGFPVFVPDLFPGDTALVEIIELRKGFARGEIVELRAPGPGRRVEPCPAAGECGGCDWTALRLDAQLEAKRGILADSLRRTGRLDPETFPPIRIHPSPLNYRLRSRLHRDMESGAVGFFARRSHEVVPLPSSCEVVGSLTLSGIAALPREGWRGDTIDLFESDEGLRVVDRNEDDEAGEDVAIRVGPWRYRLSTASFFQVNRHLLGRLIELVRSAGRDAESRDLAFDLYGGVGFFALPLSEDFRSVFSVESGRDSARWAAKNLEGRAGVKIVPKSVENFLSGTKARPDFVLVDPPRSGLSSRVRSELRRVRPKRIAYLSCDPVTFSRDVAELVGHGWALHTLDLIDLFPNTHHVETLASLVLAD